MTHFCVEMDASLMHTMKIPKRFANSTIRGEETVQLEAPSGNIWHVNTLSSKSDHLLALRSGWKEFVAAHRIGKHDTLVFAYNGSSSFKVAIFDPTGCEKAAPFFAKRMAIAIDSDKPNNNFMRGGPVPCHEQKKEIVLLSSDTNTDTNTDTDSKNSIEISSCALASRMTQERVCDKRKRQGELERKSCPFHVTDVLQESTESDSTSYRFVRKRREQIGKKPSRLYIIPQMTFLTKAQEEIANRMARRTQKGSKLFVKILTASNTRTGNCALNLPRGFACDIFQSNKSKISILRADSDNRSKACSAKYHRNKSARCIGEGWAKFVRRNGLKEGHFCLFEVRREEKQGKSVVTMLVHCHQEKLN